MGRNGCVESWECMWIIKVKVLRRGRCVFLRNREEVCVVRVE